MEHTHQSTGKSFNGKSSCVLCGSMLANIYTAKNLETGNIEHFGSNCHYTATGVDTRQIDQANARKAARAKRDDRAARNAAFIAEDMPAIEQAQAVAAEFDMGSVNPFTGWFLNTIRDWVIRWAKDTRDFDEWITDTLTADNMDPDVVDAIREGVTLIDFNKVSGKVMTSRFGGTCATCSAKISKGDEIVYNGSAHCASHAK